jgi:DNA repair exonuclease SbcCD ATPase subunit
MEWLKELLKNAEVENKESLIDSIKKKIGENFVPNKDYKKKADKISELESELNTAQDQLKTTNDKLENLQVKAENAEELENELKEIKSDYSEYKEQEDNRIKSIKTKNALEKKLLADNVPEDLVDLVVNDFNLEELKLTDEDKLLNYDDQREKAKQKRPSAFAEEKIAGDEPRSGGEPDITDNPFKVGSINLSKQAELIEGKPDTARKLIKAAGLKLSDYDSLN